jgi:hypothetical protein
MMLRHGKGGVREKVDLFAFSNIAQVSADGYAFPIWLSKSATSNCSGGL